MTNRDIKFRVWDRTYKEMLHDPECMMNTDGELYLNYDIGKIKTFGGGNYNIMISTGLSDKNGKLIYEGDFVTLRTIAHDYHTQVIFIEGCFAFKVVNPEGTLSLVFAHNVADGHFEAEVIGNIYEN